MTTVDTNILVAAHRAEHPRHEVSSQRLHRLAEGQAPWGLAVFCITEFLRVVTHPRVFSPPSSLDVACTFVDNLLESPCVRLLVPDAGYWATLRDVSIAAQVSGNLIFDAAIAALCRDSGTRTLVTMDRDFRRFDFLDLVDP